MILSRSDHSTNPDRHNAVVRALGNGDRAEALRIAKGGDFAPVIGRPMLRSDPGGRLAVDLGEARAPTPVAPPPPVARAESAQPAPTGPTHDELYADFQRNGDDVFARLCREQGAEVARRGSAPVSPALTRTGGQEAHDRTFAAFMDDMRRSETRASVGHEPTSPAVDLDAAFAEMMGGR